MLGKIDYETGGILFSLLLAPKKYCLTINNCGKIQEHKSFKGFSVSKRLLNCSECFKVIENKKISAIISKSWEKSFHSGVMIPTNMRFSKECSKEKVCNRCNSQNNESKILEAILYLLRRQNPDQFG